MKNEGGVSSEGEVFEVYVANRLFPWRDYDILDITPRIGALEDRYIESCEDPDLYVRHKRSNHSFYVECKWRTDASMKGRRIMVCKNRAQFERYRVFQAEHRPHKVYIVVGMNGTETAPSELYRIPLDSINDPWLYPDVIEEFKRSPEETFKYINGRLQ